MRPHTDSSSRGSCGKGYAEKDVVIGNDSFNNFEEVLKTAQEENADFVLLGGDLFHEADPSKHTTVQLEKLLTQYCFNDRPVQIKILSDQTQDFAEKCQACMQETLNV